MSFLEDVFLGDASVSAFLFETFGAACVVRTKTGLDKNRTTGVFEPTWNDCSARFVTSRETQNASEAPALGGGDAMRAKTNSIRGAVRLDDSTGVVAPYSRLVFSNDVYEIEKSTAIRVGDGVVYYEIIGTKV